MERSRKSFMIEDLLASSYQPGQGTTNHNTVTHSREGISHFIRRSLCRDVLPRCNDVNGYLNGNDTYTFHDSMALVQLLSLAVSGPEVTASRSPWSAESSNGQAVGEKYYPMGASPARSNGNTIESTKTDPCNLFVLQSDIVKRKMLLAGKARKGGQIRFTGEQVNLLELMFSQNKYITSDKRRDISSEVSLTEKQIKTWFQNRRAKLKKVIAPGGVEKFDDVSINCLLPADKCRKSNWNHTDSESIAQRDSGRGRNDNRRNNWLINEDSSSSSASNASRFPLSS